MSPNGKSAIRWLDKPQKHDYQAARAYLTLVMDPRAAKQIAARLKGAKMSDFAAKDIFRASGLPLLGHGNSHVEKVRALILNREKISPLLLVREPRLAKLTIADGYHRICAVYEFDEDAMIPCKIV